MGQKAGTARWGFLLVVGCLVAVGGVAAWWRQRPAETQPVAARPDVPLPGFSTSPYENVAADVSFVGSAACAECHKANHASYLHTEHSRALADLDPSAEPPDGAFQHQLSGRNYRVYRQDGQFRHEELLNATGGKEVAKVDLPIRYLIGSGHFCRSYLVEVDGFLHESPITWYTSKNKWDMSPGYDFRGHWSFERPVNVGCLHCHAGRVEQQTETLRVRIQEKAIGCESCHGPGGLHAERHRAGKKFEGPDDLTIVNPGKLPRDRLESVCATCHLHGPASIPLRGRSFGEFRPGRPLTDYQADYRFDSGNEQMTVVGHVEQLRASKCYQNSAMLSCITCHDPHAKDKPKDVVAFHRQNCLNCHEKKGCRLPVAERTKKEPADNCAACHMPRGDTDIPHVDFTHHRIGKHQKQAPPPPGRLPQLVPIGDVAHLSTMDQQRNLGLAYLAVTHEGQYADLEQGYRTRARDILTPLGDVLFRDGALANALAEIYVQTDPARAAKYAQQALDLPDLTPQHRASAMVMRTQCYLHDGDLEQAVSVLEKLTKFRRHAEDWRLLGRVYLDLYENEKALAAYLMALSIRPYRYDVHGGLAEAYSRLGDARKAREHQEKASWLKEQKQE